MAYRDVDKDTFLQRNEAAQARKTGGGSWDSWKPTASAAGKQAAKNVLRILPPHENMEDVFVEVKIHFLPSKELKDGRPIPIGVNCLAQYGEECPACNHVDRLYKMAKTEDDVESAKKQKDEAYQLGAKVRLFANVVDISHPEKGVQKYAFGPDVEKKLRQCFFDDEGEFRNITHPKTGRDVLMFVTKKPGTDFNEYVTVKCKETASPLGDMDWLNAINDLSELAKKTPLAEIEMALKGERPASPQSSAKPATTVAKPADAAPKGKAPKPAPPADEEKPAPPKSTKAPVAEKPKRQPVAEEEEHPYAAALQAIEESGIEFTPTDITPAETEKVKKPACYTKETDLNDDACQGCRVLLPCLTAKLLAEAA